MLVVANLISEVDNVFKLINRWNLLKLAYPYKLTRRKSSFGKQINSQNFIYKFETVDDYQRHWRIHFAILLSITLFSLINLHPSNNPTTFQSSIKSFQLVAFGIGAITNFFHGRHSSEMAHFLNQLLHFERSYLLLSNDYNPWSKSVNRKFCEEILAPSRLVLFQCIVMRLCQFGESILMPISSALLPHCAWNLVPVGFAKAEVKSDYFLVQVLAEILKRCVILVYNYVAWRTVTNYGSISIMIAFVMTTFSLRWSLLYFQR